MITQEISHLINEHPQLKEKAVVDFINGIDVNHDHIHVEKNNNEKFLGGLWNGLTGETQNRQNTINQHTNEALSSISEWLQCLQHHQVQSDVAIAKVADKLAETREGVMRLYGKHQQFVQQVDDLIIEFNNLALKLDRLTLKLQQVDAGRLAKQHLDAVFDKWAAGRFNHYPEIIRLYLAFDELHWGDFGNYCRQYNIEHEVKRLTQQVKDKANIQMKQDRQAMNLSTTEIWAWQETLAADIQKLTPEHQQFLAYLSDNTNAKQTPMIWAVNNLATGKNELENYHNIPILLNIENTIHRFSNDFEVRNAQ